MQINNIQDVYFSKNYGQLCEEIDGGICKEYLFSCEYGKIYSLFILKQIDYLIEGEQYYDIHTPYGYGGPIILECTEEKKLIQEFEKAFSLYCKDNKIISEFVRFHPIVQNGKIFSTIYNVTFNRKTVLLDLTDDEIFYRQISSKCRNMIRKSEKLGVRIVLDEELTTIARFQELYYLTMKKNSANNIYFFSEKYFSSLKYNLKDNAFILNAILDDKIIASAIFLYYGDNMHYHLAATDPDFYSYASGNLLLWEAIKEGQRRELKSLHLGGGTTSDEEDHLLKYKKSFGNTEKNIKEFYIGKKIYNLEIYQRLVEKHNLITGMSEKKDFFPQYRA